MSFLQIPIGTYPNTFLGYQSSIGITTGTVNTAFGYLTLNANTTGSDNSAFGSEALRFNVSGSRNTAGGADALQINNANNNTAFGYASQRGNVNGQDNSSFGHDSMRASDDGNENSAFGASSLYNAANTQGNSGFGYLSLYNVTSGLKNSAFGWASGSLITTGSKNSILGSYSGNQGGLDIRTLSNYIVLSDGDGNPRLWIDPAGLVTAPGGFSGGGGGGALTFNNQTAAYTVVSGDLGKIVNCTSGTFTVSLTAAATLGSGFNCWVWNTSSTATDVITIDPNGAETIDGRTTLVLYRGEGMQIVCDGTNWQTGDKKTMRAYAENLAGTNTRPIASGDRSIAIGSNSSATGLFSQSFGYLATATNTGATAIGNNPNASGAYSLAINADCSSTYGTAIGTNSAGGKAQAITANGAIALGGSYSSGTDSFAAAVANNTSTYGATGANSVAIGFRASASGTGSVNLGYNGTCSGSYSRNFGYESTSTGNYSIIINGNQANDNGIWGKSVIGSAFVGGGQLGIVTLRALTTDATATIMAANGVAAGSTNQVALNTNTAFAFTGTVVARQQAAGGTQSAAWKIEGLIRKEAANITTTLVASTVTVISNVPGWTLALSADTTNGALAVTATGALATNIKWLATVQTAEITYA